MTTINDLVTQLPRNNSTSGVLPNNSTRVSPATDSTFFYFYLGFIIIPGIVSNVAALYFIIRDIKKAVFPAIILLLALCGADFVAVIFSLLRHTIKRFIKDTSYNTCAVLSVLHSFFRLYAGVINTLMAVDRVLAICKPFYYKEKVETSTWKKGCIIATIITTLFCCFPIVGLGNVQTIRRSRIYCSTFSYRTEPLEKVYGLVYCIVSYLITITIVSLNAILIVSILKLRNRVGNLTVSEMTSSTDASGNTSTSRTSFEVAFARLMGCLAIIYLVCGIPYNTQVLLQQFKIYIDTTAISAIHLLAGLSYTVDPIVYILVRKTNKKCLCNMFCWCFKDQLDIIP